MKQIEGVLNVKEIDIDEILGNWDHSNMNNRRRLSELQHLSHLRAQLIQNSSKSPQSPLEKQEHLKHKSSLSIELDKKINKINSDQSSIHLDDNLSIDQNIQQSGNLSSCSSVKDSIDSKPKRRQSATELFKKKLSRDFDKTRKSEDENLKKITFSIAQSGIFNKISDDTEEFFREQIDDELEKAERAKRIDERLQEFDTDYKVITAYLL